MDALEIGKELKKDLMPLFGDQFSKLILFGSYARNDFREDSDVDFMLVLKNSDLNPFKAIAIANGKVTELWLKYDKVISLCASNENLVSSYDSPFYHNIRTEGIEL